MNERIILQVRVRDLRKQQAMTQEALAESLGISRQSVIALERGRYLPSLKIALQLRELFNLPLEEIFIFNQNTKETPEVFLPTAYPAINLIQNHHSLILEAVVTGFSRHEIMVEVDPTTITITGQPHDKEISDQYWAREFYTAPFRRCVNLPVVVNPDAVMAEVNNGILTVKMPLLAADDSKKRIEIQ